MKSIWSHTSNFESGSVSLDDALDRYATVARMAKGSIDDPDLISKINFSTRLLYVHIYKNRRYGNSWRDELMGFRLNIAFCRSKFGRLIELAWKNPRDLTDISNKAIKEKIVETLHDLANYVFFCARMLEIEYGIDYEAVRGQAIEADYEDLDLERLKKVSR